MKRIKAFFYNNQINYIIVLVVMIVCLVYTFCEKNIFGMLIIIFIILYFIINFGVNIKRSRNLKYFRYGYPLFYKKIVWINQRVSRERDMNKCPQIEFSYEANRKLLEKIPKGTICCCCTHNMIKESILKKYPYAEVTEVYKKDLIKLKKKIKLKKCETCGKKSECSLFKSEKTQFYAIKFKK